MFVKWVLLCGSSFRDLKKARSPWLLFLPIRGLYHKQDFSVPVTSLVHDRNKIGQGVFLIWCHELVYIALTLCKHACKVDCDVKSGVDPFPFWLGREQKMLGFSQVLKPIWGRIAFRTGAKIHFSEKILWGQGHFIFLSTTLTVLLKTSLINMNETRPRYLSKI